MASTTTDKLDSRIKPTERARRINRKPFGATKLAALFIAFSLLYGGLQSSDPLLGQEQSPAINETLQPRILKWADAVYPPSAVGAEAKGIVRLKAMVAADGTVGPITVVSTASSLFTPAAIDAIRKWTFEPSRINGKPVETFAEFNVEFVAPSGPRSGLTCIQVLGKVRTDGTPFTSGGCRGPALDIFHDTLADIMRESETPLSDLPSEEKELLAYLTNLAAARSTTPPPGSGMDFAFIGVQNGVVNFINSKGKIFGSSCLDCSLLVSDFDIADAATNDGTGVILKLSPNGQSVAATCRAAECLIRVEKSGVTSNSRLVNGQTISSITSTSREPKGFPLSEAPTSARIYFRLTN